MFDFSWSEILLVAVVALVVIGPKDLPRVLRNVGIWVGRARAIAREFQGQIDQMVRESELDDVRTTMAAATSLNPEEQLRKLIDPTGDLAKNLSTTELLGQNEPPKLDPDAPVVTADTATAETPAAPIPFPLPNVADTLAQLRAGAYATLPQQNSPEPEPPALPLETPHAQEAPAPDPSAPKTGSQA